MGEADWQKKRCAPIQLRVLNVRVWPRSCAAADSALGRQVLKTWIENYFFDFNDGAIRKLEDFIDNVIALNNARMAKTLRSLVTKKARPAGPVFVCAAPSSHVPGRSRGARPSWTRCMRCRHRSRACVSSVSV
jgi:hypothetical protein